MVIGPRAMGMGGAGVASTRGSLSLYWNPASLAPPRRPRVDPFFDLALTGQAGALQTKDLVTKLDNLLSAARDVAASIDGIQVSPPEGKVLRQILRVVDAIPPLFVQGTGVQLTASPTLTFRLGRFGFGAMGFLYGSGLGNLDLDFLALGVDGIGTAIPGTGMPSVTGFNAADELAQFMIDLGLDPAEAHRVANELVFEAEQAGLDPNDPAFQDMLERIIEATEELAQRIRDGSIDAGKALEELFNSNKTGVNLRGISTLEFGVGYSQPLFDLVSIGVAPKLLYGTTYFNPVFLFDDFDDVLTEFFKNSDREETLTWGLDVGALVMPTEWLSIGVVGKYLNQPSFDFAGPGDYKLDPQVRGGVALGPFAGFTFALDIDLLKNSSDSLPGFQSQFIAGGVEYNLLDTLFLRAGVSKNLAESVEDPGIHFGLGTRVFGLNVDLAAMMIPDLSRLEDLELPERAAFSLMLGIQVPIH